MCVLCVCLYMLFVFECLQMQKKALDGPVLELQKLVSHPI